MKNIISLFATLLILMIVTSLSVLYSEGWRINIPSNDPSTNDPNGNQGFVKKTGMLAVRSIPDGAKVYIDGKLITATNDTIASLNPQDYTLKVEKEGFETWEKRITVYSELVTDITAVLISQTPKLEPLTSNEVKAFALSSDYNDIIYLTGNINEPGIWTLPLANSPLNILRNSSRLLVQDTAQIAPSSGSNIWWSWSRKEILVELNPKGYLLYKSNNNLFNNPLNSVTLTPQQVTDKDDVFERWNQEFQEDFVTPKLAEMFREQQMPELIKNNQDSKITWAPDENKFILQVPNAENSALIDLIVYNGEETLPVGEQRLNYTLTGIDPTKVKYSWYSDSYHLIILTNVEGRESDYTVSLIRIDGTNQTPVYTGYLASDQAFTTPFGDKIVVLTSLKEGSLPNLYGIAIR